jgi:hypothetical protein
MRHGNSIRLVEFGDGPVAAASDPLGKVMLDIVEVLEHSALI